MQDCLKPGLAMSSPALTPLLLPWEGMVAFLPGISTAGSIGLVSGHLAPTQLGQGSPFCGAGWHSPVGHCLPSRHRPGTQVALCMVVAIQMAHPLQQCPATKWDLMF